MSVTTFNCPGFAENERGDGLDIGSSGNTIPVIVQEVGDRVKIICVALKGGECRKAEGEITNKDTLGDEDIKWEDCPYVQLLDGESEASEVSGVPEEFEASEASGEFKVSEALEASGEFKVAEVSGVPEEFEASEASEASGEFKVSEALEASGESKVAGTSEASKKSKAPDTKEQLSSSDIDLLSGDAIR